MLPRVIWRLVLQEPYCMAWNRCIQHFFVHGKVACVIVDATPLAVNCNSILDTLAKLSAGYYTLKFNLSTVLSRPTNAHFQALESQRAFFITLPSSFTNSTYCFFKTFDARPALLFSAIIASSSSACSGKESDPERIASITGINWLDQEHLQLHDHVLYPVKTSTADTRRTEAKRIQGYSADCSSGTPQEQNKGLWLSTLHHFSETDSLLVWNMTQIVSAHSMDHRIIHNKAIFRFCPVQIYI